MPNSKQAKKRMRQDEERRAHNKSMRTTMRTAMKRVLRAADRDAAEAALPTAMKRIDKAAKTRVIHANAAARYKSRLSRHAREKSAATG
jgi:small subunit ribosomal protein S20